MSNAQLCNVCEEIMPLTTQRCPLCDKVDMTEITLTPELLERAQRTWQLKGRIRDREARAFQGDLEGRVREAQAFLIGLGALALLLFASTSLSDPEPFYRRGDDRHLFVLLIENARLFGIAGAWLLLPGLGFWYTRKLAFAYVGALGWAFLLTTPWLVLLSDPGPGPKADVAELEVGAVEVKNIVKATLFWLTMMALPLYRFRELAQLRKTPDPTARA